MKITNKQIRFVHYLFKDKGIAKDVQQSMVLASSDGRTEKVSELKGREVNFLISNLKGESEGVQRMKKKIIAICYELGWVLKEDKDKIDWTRVNGFCKERGHAKKVFNKYDFVELPTLVTQFEKLLKSSEEKELKETD